ncbi:MAG: DGQHR domain-containing protein [Spirochaetaceae bacterium]
MKLQYLTITQPIGSYYLSVIEINLLYKYCFINRRDYDPQLFISSGGIQRKDSKERIKNIQKYCEDPDATFPSAIIVSIDSDNFTIDNNTIEFNENEKNLFEIIDGQHRLLGITESSLNKSIQIPLVIMPDLTEEEKAYVFSTINSNQKKIDPSLIYDLFHISETRSPFKTMHELARALNSDENSPFYRRLKMLGKKQLDSETISQGTFVNYLINLISKKPKEDTINIKNRKKIVPDEMLPLRYYFIREEDSIIYKIIFNYFKAAENIFNLEWNDPKKYIINRTAGFGGLTMALNKIIQVGLKKNTLDLGFFEEILSNYKNYLKENNKILDSNYYPSNNSIQRKIRDEIYISNNLDS